MKILVINSGSSSIKYKLFEMEGEEVLSSGIVERIGLPMGKISHKVFDKDGNEKKAFKELVVPNHQVGLNEVVHLLLDNQVGVISDTSEISAVGHRLVHGAEYFSDTTLITDEVMEKVEEVSPLAPLHNPPNLEGVKVCKEIFPYAKQVGVFDTAFHQSMPDFAYRYAIPTHLYEEEHIRAYGMHGTSHLYVSKKAIEHLDLQGKESRIITIHLGNGCSMTAVKDGKCVDCSMGFSPLSGLIMGTRSGDIDPAVIFYLHDKVGMSMGEINELLNKKSGMLGLTGHSDMRDIEQECHQGDSNAKLATQMYAYRIKKYIGTFLAALNGVDGIVFTAGVGENDSKVREMAVEGLENLGIFLDPVKNNLRAKQIEEVQAEASKVKILVIPTDEELEIAQQSQKLIKNQ
ncbi:acetate/propionate family kinase [Xanthovirga aplysinae]|uniref:acetate/propionate family kinase n=1 Tax=Xanthovirga aplysinae TaxID=2529853 RepID=UPI0012BD2520|nr:acetate kinase [Xanthovirga aplysinae]MTI33350.1 acetate kinase [Xanthovirga aplysinae]